MLHVTAGPFKTYETIKEDKDYGYDIALVW